MTQLVRATCRSTCGYSLPGHAEPGRDANADDGSRIGRMSSQMANFHDQAGGL